MRRKWMAIFICFLLVVTPTGCWSRRELDTLGLATGAGIDQTENGYRVSVQVVNPEQIAETGGQGPPVTTLQTEADTLFECLRKLTIKSPRKAYFSHFRMIVISEEVSRKGVRDILDFFSRDHETRTDFFIVIAKKTPALDVLSHFTHIQKIPSQKLFDSLTTSQEAWAPTVGVQLDQLITDIVSEGKEPVLTGVYVQGKNEIGNKEENIRRIHPPALLAYTPLGVLKKDRLVGWLNERESIGYNYALNNVKNTVGDVPCPKGGKLVIEVVRSKGDIRGSVENGVPHGKINIQVEGNIGEVSCQIDLNDAQTYYELEKRAEQRIKKYVLSSIKKSKQLQSDIFGFGDAIYRDNPRYWKKIKKDWDQRYPQLKVDVQVDVKLQGSGTVGNSFIQKMEK
ncbi:Ger(x)C family spore germination protein [Melghirimyces algeriensis]|uniref:Spore germination protein KC n=1 Tax=Melghirimyces algeriensis TaxID=910412 RepID=A0A521DK91_9BACL|nr:Ger(x)C family spore germination protein [Melghirimyces algeriensis]SMO72129.1 spore germination protein KC [Melghirimyces algeriensis]